MCIAVVSLYTLEYSTNNIENAMNKYGEYLSMAEKIEKLKKIKEYQNISIKIGNLLRDEEAKII